MRALTEDEAMNLVRSKGRDEALTIIDECGGMSLLRFDPKPGVIESPQCEWSFCQTAFNVLSSITLPPPPTDKA